MSSGALTAFIHSLVRKSNPEDQRRAKMDIMERSVWKGYGFFCFYIVALVASMTNDEERNLLFLCIQWKQTAHC